MRRFFQFSIGLMVIMGSSLPISSSAAQVALAAGSVTIDSPATGASITGPVRISGSYTSAYNIVIGFNAGPLSAVHLVDPDGNESGTWYYDWVPSGYSGNVEIRVRSSNVDDRYWNWATPTQVTVDIPAQQPPSVSILSPLDGATASGVTPIAVSAFDAQGLGSVQVRIDWGSWQAATLSGGNYVYNWDTAGLGNKTHAVEAQATDSNGNVIQTLTNYVKTGSGTNEPPAVKQSDRAMWVWEASAYQLVENVGARQVLAQFMDDATVSSHLRKTIYLYADRFDNSNLLLSNPAEYRSFISWAHARGYYVHALVASGSYLSPAYVYSTYHPKAIRLIENVLNYNISSAPAEQFDGINIDIEPYVLGDWITGSPSLQTQYLDMLDKMMQRKVAAGQNLNVGPAIARWYDIATECQNITWKGTTKNCAQHIQDTVDYVAIMDYRDQVDDGTGQGVIFDAQNEINYADSLGKKVMIGVETDQISASGDPESVSFQEEGRTYMEGQLNQVYTHYAASPSFLGTVIHYLDAYRKLPTVWSSTGTVWQSSVADASSPGTPATLTAAAWDWQRVDLHWARSSDDTEVDHYEVHRSTTSNFTPGSATLVSTVRQNFASDWGLLAGTTYYYKVIAVDVSGKKSAASTHGSAATPVGVGLIPVKILSIAMKCNRTGTASAAIKVTTLSGTALGSIKVVGHWEDAAGKKFVGNNAANGGRKGTYTPTSQSLTLPYRGHVMPERLLGY